MANSPGKAQVLIIQEDPLFRDFLVQRLSEAGVEVHTAANGLEGFNKMALIKPRVTISEFNLSGKDIKAFMKAKIMDKDLAPLSLYITTAPLPEPDTQFLEQHNVARIFTKPLKIDSLLSALAETLKVNLHLDPTPSILEVHLNEDLLFVEVGRGLNQEKILLLEYKAAELLKLHQVSLPKVLVLFNDVKIGPADKTKLNRLLGFLLRTVKGRIKWVRLLTQSKDLENTLRTSWEFGEMEVYADLAQALEDHWSATGASGDTLPEVWLERLEESQVAPSSLAFRLASDLLANASPEQRLSLQGRRRIAVVDDDFVVQEILKNTFSHLPYEILTFDDGKQFLDSKPEKLDLVFLDLMMPGLNGFQVLDQLARAKSQVPIIILSALTRRETVLRAMGYGIRRYLIKPLKPQELLTKAAEVLDLPE